MRHAVAQDDPPLSIQAIWKPAPEAASASVLGRRLPRGRVEAVEEIRRGDPQHQSRELLLVVVLGGGVPNRVRNRIGPVVQPCGLGERESGALGVGEVRCIPPGRYGEQLLVRHSGLLRAPRPPSTQGLQPLIWLTRKWTSSSACFGTPAV